MALTSGALLDDRDTLRGDARVVRRDEEVGVATLAAVEVREPVQRRERTPARARQMPCMKTLADSPMALQHLHMTSLAGRRGKQNKASMREGRLLIHPSTNTSIH